MAMMKAAVFVERGRIELADKTIPDVGPNDALIRITTTTICGTDIHILKGEYPVAKGLTIGHEPVGVIEKLGSAVTGYQEGQRVIAGAICPNFNSYAAQDGVASQDGSYLIGSGACGAHGYKATAGWRFGNLIDGTQAEYVLVPDAQGNLAHWFQIAAIAAVGPLQTKEVVTFGNPQHKQRCLARICWAGLVGILGHVRLTNLIE